MILTKTQLMKFTKTDLIDMILSTQNGLTALPKTGTEIIEDYKWVGTTGSKIVKINGKKFKIVYNNSNGFPLGFNYKFSASVMDDNGKWNYVAEKKDIGYKEVSYVSNESVRKQDSIKFIDAMIKYLERVYN